MPFVVTRDGLTGKSLVFLNFEFPKPAHGGAQAPRPENTEAQGGAPGSELLRDESLPAGEGRVGRVAWGAGIPGAL